MSRSALHTLIGVFLFGTGLFALYGVLSPSPAAQPTQAIDDQTPPTVPVPVDQVEGLGLAVELVLSVAGRAGPLGPDELSQIPPEVTRVLIEKGVTLTIPLGGEG